MKRKKKDQPTKESLTKADIKRVCDILRRDDGVGAKDYIEQFSWLLFLKVFEGVEGQLKELEEAEGRKYKPVIDAEYQWSSWAKKDWKDKDELIHFINQKLFPYLKGLKGEPKKDKIGEIFRELSGNRIRSPHNLLDVIEILDKIEKHHFQDTHLLSQVYEEILQAMGSEGGWSGEFYTPRPIIRLMVKIVNPELGETVFDPFVGSGGFLVESFNHIYEKSAKDVRAWRTLQTKTFYGQEKKPLPFLIGTMNLILHHILVPNLTRSNTFMEDVHNMPESAKMSVILTNPPFGAEETQTVRNNYPIQVAATEALALQYIMKRLKNGGRCGVVLPEGNILSGGGVMARIREELLSKFNVHTIISLPQGAFAQVGASVKTNLIFFDKTGPTKEIWYGEVKGKFTKTQVVRDDLLEEVFAKSRERKVSDTSWIVPFETIKERGFDLSPQNPNNDVGDDTLPPDEIIKEIGSNQSQVDELVSSVREMLEKNPHIENATSLQTYTFYDLFEKVSVGKKYSKKEVRDSGAVPVIDQSKNGVFGYHNNKPDVIASPDAPIVTFANHTRAVRLMTGSFSAIQNVFPLKTTELVLPQYAYYLLQDCVPNGGYKGHYPILEKLTFQIPSIDEQRKVIDSLSELLPASEELSGLYKEQEKLFTSLRASVLSATLHPKSATAPVTEKPIVSPVQEVAIPKMFDIQQAVAQILNRFERGEMVVAKVLYLGQALFGVPTNIQFSAQNFGPYDTAVKKAVTAGLSPRNKFFAKKGAGANQVLTLGTNASKILKYSTSTLARKTNAYLDQMLPLFNQSDSAGIERLATLCKIIEDEKTADEATVKAKLQEWKPNRFTDEEVSRTLAFIKKQGWDQTLLK